MSDGCGRKLRIPGPNYPEPVSPLVAQSYTLTCGREKDHDGKHRAAYSMSPGGVIYEWESPE